MIKIPESYNYVSAFITFNCNLNCHYCINKYNGLYKYEQMVVDDWIKGLNRIKTRSDFLVYNKFLWAGGRVVNGNRL